MHSTPIADLEVILMVPPLGIYIKGEARQVRYRLKCSGDSSKIWSFGGFRKDDWWVAISSGPRGQNRSYYCFWKGVFSWTSTKKLLTTPGNVGNFDQIVWFSTETVHSVKAGRVLECFRIPLIKGNHMHLAYLLRSSKQKYMQFLPVLTTVEAQTCTIWRFVYVLIARLCCWLYPHMQFRLNF
jgi:hypothetical protein